MPDTREAQRRAIWMPDQLWEEVAQAARLRSVAEGEDVSRNEIVRRGIRRELQAINGDDEYEAP